MKKDVDFLMQVNGLIHELALPHVPEGSHVQAVIDQWVHAVAIGGSFFCDKTQSDPVRLKNEVLELLTNNDLFNGSSSDFFDKVFEGVNIPPSKSNEFKFIDLFAGIGGLRIGFQHHGGACVFSSEYDASAQETYRRNYGEVPFGDITKITESFVPDHDVLLAGFPCQPFSRAGVSAREAVGTSHGFLCKSQGTLFFDVMRIVMEKRPKIIFLENVRNIVTHDKGNTFNIIRETVEGLGYSFSYKLINSKSLVPQNRLRCYMVGVREDVGSSFLFPDIDGDPLPLRMILEPEPDDIYTISDRLWSGHIARTKRNVERGTGFTAYTANLDKPSNTIVARYGKDGKECLIPQEGKNPRLLTKRECARIQGFPENFILPEARTPTYKQFGNSVTVPVVSKLAEKIVKDLL